MSSAFETPREWHGPRWWQNRSLEERLFHTRVPKRLQVPLDAPVENDWLEAWTAAWEPTSSLLLTGAVKSGKSYTAVHALNILLQTHKLSGRFVDADNYIEMIKASFDSKDGTLPEMYSSPHLIQLIKGVFDVVVLDGLGQERQTDFAKHELGTLLRQRHDNGLSTIITSTLGTVDLIHVYGERVSACLEDMKTVKYKHARE